MMAKEKSKLENEKRACVVVLGDFGRSPRMQYHALSLAKNSFIVDVVAYKGAEPLDQVSNNDKIHIHNLQNVPNSLGSFPKLLQYIFKTLWQALFLFWTLITVPKMDFILLQNPPSIPTLPVCWFVCWIRSGYLFIDFHNYGYTILALSARKDSLLVKTAKWCEKLFARKAHKSICVTKAMKDDLSKNWDIRASVCYDCAPDIFHPISLEEKHSLFMEMSKIYHPFKAKNVVNVNAEATRFTKNTDGKCELLVNRPALVVSSTSWTEDEDFSVLLTALEDYEKSAKENPTLPNLLVAITGKGPLKAHYENLIQVKKFSRVEIITLWLKFEDYPKFLACADLGISLHNSSSGLDLPMKVVDMFGSCLPVAAISFNCIDELVKEGINGTIFSNSQQLSLQLENLFTGFPQAKTKLNVFKRNLNNSTSLRWDENWYLSVSPLIAELYQEKALHSYS